MLKTLQIKTTKRDEMIDITHEVETFLQETGITSGAALIYCPHTTAGITINENADPDVKKICSEGLMRYIRGNMSWTAIWRAIQLHT